MRGEREDGRQERQEEQDHLDLQLQLRPGWGGGHEVPPCPGDSQGGDQGETSLC